MSQSGIFLRSGASLVVMQPAPYDSEAVLQAALAESPEVIAGATTSGETEPRLLLITREMGVPGSDASGTRFSLDHLFVDADCVPVLVEVKRASDTRIRREVVGQMLDYAANGVKYWPLGSLQESLAKRAAAEGRDVAELVAELNPELSTEDFWERVEDNLASGRVRLLFVADELPPELIRIIEFLNEQMTPAEVLGVQLKQFVHGEHVAFVPEVVGQTSVAMSAKGPRGAMPWTRETFLEAARSRVSETQFQLIQRLFADVDRRGNKLNWGRGGTPGVAGWYVIGGRPTGLWVLNASTESPDSRAYLQFYLGDHLAWTSPEVMELVAAHLEKIPSMKHKIAEARASDWKKYPTMRLEEVAGRTELEQALFDAITVLVDAPSST